MLKGINPLLSPDLLKILSEMGHGDEIIIADGGFPAARLARNLVRADATGCVAMLDAVLSVIPLDQYDSQNFVLMETTGKSIYEIAIECGFPNSSNFYRLYKKHTGESPRQGR